MDENGAPAAAEGVAFEVNADGGADVSALETLEAVAKEGAQLRLRITPMSGVDAVVSVGAYLVADAEIRATATITASAAPRVASALNLMADTDAIVLEAAAQETTLRFTLSGMDNYGDGLEVELALEVGAGAHARLRGAARRSVSATPIEILAIAGLSADAAASVTLKATASLGGVTLAQSASVALSRKPPPAIAGLRLEPASVTLFQMQPGETLTTTLLLTVVDENGAPAAAEGVAFEVNADGGADVSALETLEAVAKEGAQLRLRITPMSGVDAVVSVGAYLVADAEIRATATITASAAPRVASALNLMADTDAIVLEAAAQETTLRFTLSGMDNYGDGLEVELALEVGAGAHARLRGAARRSVSATPIEILAIAGLSADAAASVTLTATASLGGVTLAQSASVALSRKPPPAIAGLRLEPANVTLFQMQPGETLTTTLLLTVVDENGAPAAAEGVAFEVSADGGADVSALETLETVAKEGAQLRLRITPMSGVDAVVSVGAYLVADAEIRATATITASAAPRVASALNLMADTDAIVLEAAAQETTLRFTLSGMDNYGDGLEVELALEVGAGAHARLRGAARRSVSATPIEILAIAGLSADAAASVTLTATASLGGVTLAQSAVVELSRNPRPLLDILGHDRKIDSEELLITLRYLGGVNSGMSSNLLRNLRRSSNAQSDSLMDQLKALGDAGDLDLDGDGDADAEDARFLIRYWLGVDASLPSEFDEAKARRLLGL